MLSGCQKWLREFRNTFEMETETIEIPGLGWTWECLQVLPVTLGNRCTLLPHFLLASGLCRAAQTGCTGVCALRAALLSSPAGSSGREFSQPLVAWQQYTRFTAAFNHLFQGLQTFDKVRQTGEKMLPIPSHVLGSEHSLLLPARLLALVTAFICPFSNSQLDLPQCPVFFLLLLTEPAGIW